LFGIEYSLFADAVAIIAPDFRLLPEEELAARGTTVPAGRNVSNRIVVWYLKWERCLTTSWVSNPYVPWIEIWEHGGSFGVEHGQFVDVFASDSMPVGAVVVRRA
jgi:hypothetical protein